MLEEGGEEIDWLDFRRVFLCLVFYMEVRVLNFGFCVRVVSILLFLILVIIFCYFFLV